MRPNCATNLNFDYVDRGDGTKTYRKPNFEIYMHCFSWGRLDTAEAYDTRLWVRLQNYLLVYCIYIHVY
jgi:hypothetical protein